jgi:hypothetical protein
MRPVAVKIGQIEGDAHQIAGVPACPAQREEKVPQGTFKLRQDVPAFDPPVRALSGLPGKEDQAAPRGGHRMGEPGRPGKLAWVDPFESHVS